MPSSFKIEFGIYATQLNHGSSNVAFLRFNSSSGVFVGKGSNNNGTIYYFGQTVGTMTVNTDYDFVLTYENGSSSLTDGTTTKTSSNTLSKISGLSSWNYSYFKYIKLKPL